LRILIIIPAYNEAENIERVIKNLSEKFPCYEYIIVNDGSTDDTALICEANNYQFINLPVNLGLAGAFQTGMQYAYQNGYEAALQFDGDGQHDPIYIEDMISTMKETGADIVIGSRFYNKKKPLGLRMLGSRLIALAIRISAHKKISDPTSGFRLFNRSILEEFAYNVNFGPEPDTVAYLIKNGAKAHEIQVDMNDRIAGESYFNAIKSVQYMMRMLFSIILIQHFRKRRK